MCPEAGPRRKMPRAVGIGHRSLGPPAASATALTPGADVPRRRERPPEDAVPAKADNEAKPTAATTAVTTK